MTRSLAWIYAIIASFALMIYIMRGGGELEPSRIIAAMIFLLVSGPLIRLYWIERDKARKRRPRDNARAEKGGS